VTLSLFGIFIFTSPFLRVLAVLISARWMVLRFTGKQVNTSYSSEIERFVILGKSVVKLNELREIYVSKLAETEFSNPNYRRENFKVNLKKAYGYPAQWN
jgi:hypothetical protein